MMPGLGGLSPKKVQAMMKQMGINQEEVPALKVTIEKHDNSKIIINNPNVQKINMQGQESFQISGEIQEESVKPEISMEDIKMVMEKTSCSEEQAKQALEKTNDIAEAIIQLSD
jgi:nascent polypeptide-associated complex subunit alpha